MRILSKRIAVLLAVVLVMLPMSAAASSVTEQATGASVLYGDLNGDGKVNTTDALLALRAAVGKMELSDAQKTAADVDGSGVVNSTDALLILRKAVDPSSLFPVEENQSAYELNYVEPVGLTAGTIYNIDYTNCLNDATFADYDLTRLAACIQGLVNRNFAKHHVAVSLNLDANDPTWLRYMMGTGRTYNGMSIVNIRTTESFLSTFDAFMKAYGIIAWDPAVPSTSNVASTICGLENCLPVQYSETAGSLYQVLLTKGIPVKQTLVGKFENAAVGKKIADSNVDSSGSSKCDAYLWALDKYFDKTNMSLLAYTPDGACSVPTNALYGQNAKVIGIPNHDYFIYKQCFFFDLTTYGGEAPNDDPSQPVGTDANTFKKILQARYDNASGTFGMVVGFPPWHIKYTNFVGNYALDPARLEWQCVEVVTSYNCGLEADAAHPCWMSNGSLYTNYKRVVAAKANTAAKDVTYDANTLYYTIAFSGDYDCSPWLKNRAITMFKDKSLGSVAVSYNFNLNLVDRFPVGFDYIYENKTDNDYILAGEGLGYVFPSALTQGFVGKEQDPITRTLPTAKRLFYNFAKPYYTSLQVDTMTRVINGFSVVQTSDMDVLAQLAPNGVYLQNSAAGSYDFRMYRGTPFMRINDISGSTTDERVRWLYAKQNTLAGSNDNFTPIGFFNVGLNYVTATGVSDFVAAYKAYVSGKATSKNYEYVDINTFNSLIKQSGQGLVVG